MSVAEPESPVMKTPEWLEVLENKRKRTHKLAHEIGAGAPCLVCKEKCKGLNLHFWRKLCIECKCRKEDHEVQEEEDYAQFEILFGAKKVKRTTLKFNAQNKSFDWIPPNVSPDLVVDYLKSLPESKLPISNSEGARYRKQQLEKQVPLHDVDPNACFNLSDKEVKEFQKYLDNLKDNVIGQGKILKYQCPKMIKENYLKGTSPNMMSSSEAYAGSKPQAAQVLGHLNVEKTPGFAASSECLRTDSYPAGVNYFTHSIPTTTDVKSSKPLHSETLQRQQKLNSQTELLRHSFLQSSTDDVNQLQALYTDSLERNKNLHINHPSLKQDLNSQSNSNELADFHIMEEIGKNKNFNYPSLKRDFNVSSPKPFQPYGHNQRNEHCKLSSDNPSAGFQTNTNLKTPSSFINKTSPIYDKHNNNAHPDDNYNVDLTNLKEPSELGNTFNKFGNNISGEGRIAFNMDPRSDLLDRFKDLNVSNRDPSSDKNYNIHMTNVKEHPELNYIGENNTKTGFNQDPYSATVYKDTMGKFNEFNTSSNEVPFVPVQEAKNIYSPFKNLKPATGQNHFNDEPSNYPEDYSFPTPPSTCQQCLEILNPEEVVVQTEQGGNSALWHAKCFVCETCKELLVDLMYFFNKGKVYCGRHYAEMMKIPRCYGCDELIFMKEYTIAEDKTYHVRHFCCFHCDEPLGGKQYIPKDSYPVCLSCYQIKYGKNCHTCQRPIAAGDQRVSWKDLDFHVSPECFRCTQCKKSLLGGKFVVKNSNVFCSKECVQVFVE